MLRPATSDDVDAFAAILAQPEVARWWSTVDPVDTARELVATTESEAYAIELAGRVAGCVQLYEETDPDYRHAGLDIFLGAEHQGQGLGPEALRLVAEHLFSQRGHHRLVIDPRADNERAIRAYERVGFRPVGVMRQYELGADGVWRDGLLMDMLRHELAADPSRGAR